jgi:hypothetical protein
MHGWHGRRSSKGRGEQDGRRYGSYGAATEGTGRGPVKLDGIRFNLIFMALARLAQVMPSSGAGHIARLIREDLVGQG